MKEILYISAGELSNYTGTHFWNAQESYLQLNEGQSSQIASDISFCETTDAEGRATLCPRLLVFDRKSNFGTLGRTNALGAMAGEPGQSLSSLWSGDMVEYRQGQIKQSSYHTRLEEQDQGGADVNQSKEIGDVRYWSDFNRVYYLPRSLQRLPDVPDWESTNLDWDQGQELFANFNEASELMDGDLRLLVEDCDHMQGLQLINDTDGFGSFMGSFLSSFRDEYQKLPSFTFPILSGVMSSNLGWDERAKRIVNEALYLRVLNELSSINIPIEHPTVWPDRVWSSPLNFPSSSRFHQAAVLSAHFETCTLPFRLRQDHQDMTTLSAKLKSHTGAPFAELQGIFPLSGSSDFNNRLFNLSSNFPVQLSTQFARLSVTRGFSSRLIEDYNKRKLQYQQPNLRFSESIHALAYPLADTFPPFGDILNDLSAEVSQSVKTSLSIPSSPMVQSYSSISLSANTARMLERYASFVEKCVTDRGSTVAAIDISLDDLRDLMNDLWTMHDNCSAESEENSTL